jgi:hypothetical protein
MSYRYDPDTRAYVARLLWEHLPSWYREKDTPPSGEGELQAFLQVLSAPLAILRQNIEELHANLFIDSADDWVIALLAQMVGTTLVFPDAASNRRDVRDTVSWRKRKGTPLMLQDLGGDLTGHLVVTREGWKLVQISQDLNLLRRERVVPDLRPAIVAELDHGPLVTLHHAVDARAIAENTGKYHPKQVIHWAHPTQFFEVREGTPADLRDPPTDPDYRYAFHPLGEFLPLRARRTGESDTLKTDYVPPLHFATSPGDWFGRDGRFTVLLHGIAAAVAGRSEDARTASTLGATPEVMDGAVTLTLLDHEPRRFRGAVRVQVIGAPVAIPGPAVPDTNPVAIDIRAEFDIDAGGATATNVVNAAAVDPAQIVMLRVLPLGTPARFFPGADIEIAGGVVNGVLAAHGGSLAAEGFLRGALFVRLPAALINGERWYFVAADGSLYDAQSTGSGAVDAPVSDTGGSRFLPSDRLSTPGPGPAWPPQLAVFDPEPLTAVPSAPGYPPVVVHGGRAVRSPGGVWQDVAAGTRCSLVLAASFFDGLRRYRPFLRLEWNGPDPAGAAATVIGDDGLPAADAAVRFREIADLRETGPNQFRMAVRFECELDDAILAQSEVAYTSYDGGATLLHLPDLICQAVNPAGAEWNTDPAFAGISDAVVAGADGSTWLDAAAANARMSAGQVLPMRQYLGMRRRRAQLRSLCQWRNEIPMVLMHEGTAAGFLDIDPAHGLFAMAGSEPPDADSVTVIYQEGYTRHTGARAAAREPELDQPLDPPTRIVSASGHFRESAPPETHNIPLYDSLAAALADIQAAPAPSEVIQIEDSATYPNENWTWPANCPQLTIQAAERERPVIDVTAMNSAGGASYERIVLRGLTFGGAAGALAFPPSALVQIQFCTVTQNDNEMQLELTSGPEQERVEILRSVTAGLVLNGPGVIQVFDSVIDAGAGGGAAAVTAADGRLEVDRTTVFGTVDVFVLEASEAIFNDDVTVTNRFEGCVRYSRVTSASVLPRRHRVVVDTPARYVSVNRRHPAHARLSERCDRSILRGAEDGSEMGAFHDVQHALRYEGFFRRLVEYTPAGLTTGIIRVD